jgi:hypothetical protein
MNRRLPGPTAFLLRFPRRPLERPQRFIQPSDFMILRNHVIQRGLKERPLLPDQHRLRPSIRRSHRIQLPRPASNSASSPRMARARLDIQVKSLDLRNTSTVPKGVGKNRNAAQCNPSFTGWVLRQRISRALIFRDQAGVSKCLRTSMPSGGTLTLKR